MANIFPSWTNWLPIKISVALALIVVVVSLGVTYYFTPKYTRVGYAPIQPVNFDHSLHVSQLGMDCRYCHTAVEISSASTVPNTQICMNCHRQVKSNSPKLAPIRESWNTGEPVEWVKVHVAPDYVYFNHAVHVNRGISCVSCHGQINQMQVVSQTQPMSMGWCLDCHRHPEKSIRPINQVFNLDWKPAAGESQQEIGTKLIKEWNVRPPETCEGCHR